MSCPEPVMSGNNTQEVTQQVYTTYEHGFVYDSSIRNGYSARFLNLLPSTEFVSPLVCSMYTVQLDKCPPFEALSYTWGMPDKSHSIVCDGQILRITANLSEALRQVRLPDTVRTLWADQICINQADEEERGHQVSLMKQIYQQSDRTLICLGQSDKAHAPIVAELVAAVNCMIQEVFTRQDFTWEANSFPFPNPTDKLLTHQGWESFPLLVQQLWFKRVWVVQEAALACEANVHWANTVLPWLDILRAYTWYTRRGLKLPHLLKTWLPNIHLQGFYDKRSHEALTFQAAELEHMNILEILDSARWLGATDPRDRIYAFLSAQRSNKVFSKLRPRYDILFMDVYRQFAYEYLRTSKDLDLLHFVDNDDNALQDDVPSWVPRWNTHLYSSPTGNLNNYHKWCPRISSQGQPVEVRISTSDGSLQLQALLIDAVAFTGNAFHRDSTSIDDISTLWKTVSKQHSPLLYTCDPLDAFLTVFRCGIYRGRLVDWEASQSAYKVELQEANLGSSRAGHASEKFHELRMMDVHNKRFFISTRGYYGLAPEPVRPDDVCCVIFGTRSPFIVRRTAEAGRFKLVGSTLMLSKRLDHNGYPLAFSGDKDVQEWRTWGLEEKFITLA